MNSSARGLRQPVMKQTTGFVTGIITAAAFIAAAVGLFVAVAWYAGIDGIKAVIPGLAAMKMNTAMLFILSGVLLLFTFRGHTLPNTARTLTVYVTGSIIFITAALTLLQYLLNTDFGIDRLLYAGPDDSFQSSHPGRMSVFTAINFMLFSSGVLLYQVKSAYLRAVYILPALAGLAFSVLALIGYIYTVEELYRIEPYTSMALHTALVFYILFIALLFIYPEHPYLRIFFINDSGGTIARRLLPAVVLLPIALGLLQLQAEVEGWITPHFGLAITTALYIFILGGLALYSALEAHRFDSAQREALQSLKENREAIENYSRQQEALAAMGIEAVRSRDMASLMQHVVEKTAKVLDVAFCKVLRYLPDEKKLLLEAGVGWKEEYIGHHKLDLEEGSQAGYTLISSKPIIVEDIRTDKRLKSPALLLEHGVVSGMSVLIYGLQEPYGAIGVHSSERRQFSDDDINFVQSVANIIAESIQVLEAQRAMEELNKELEQRVERRTAQLEASNQELEAFSYSVSHDLRTPLRAISGFTRILEEEYGDKLDEEGRRITGIIKKGAVDMNQLINDLLSFSRMGRRTRDLRHIDMKTLAQEALDELLQQEDKRVQHRIDDLPPAYGDRSMIKQALANLISNAIKFSQDAEKPEITIGYSMADEKAVYYVRDNGVGFDMKYKNKLFGVFQRLHSPEQFEGTGVGLALVHRIIKRHKGEVWAESEPGKGATFYFTLPRKT